MIPNSQGQGARRTEPGRTRVGLFVDYDTLRLDVQEAGSGIDASEIANRVSEIAREEGRVVLACAFADWTNPEADPRPFRRQQMDPRLVLPDEEGESRAWLVLALDALEALLAEPRIDTFVLAGASPEFEELLRRIRKSDRRIVLCSAGLSSPPELAPLADRRIRLEEVQGSPDPEGEGAIRFEQYDWTPFIRALDMHEKRMEFIGIGLLLKKILDARNCGTSSYNGKREIFEKAKECGIIEIYTVPNIDEGGDPVSACRLNRAHEMVRRELDAGDREAKAPGMVESCEEQDGAS
jgi:hypothetical protein